MHITTTRSPGDVARIALDPSSDRPPAAEFDTAAGTAVAAPTSLGLRLEFLDALRGIAAMLVVVEHFAEHLWPAFAVFSLTRFRLGEYGVVLFFLVSGFIIPASLERRGSLSQFWVGRAFRLFPLYWACLAAILVLHFGPDSYRGLAPEYWTRWLHHFAFNATMMQDFLGVPLVLGQSWSLAYEMTFYLLVSVLFVAGRHTRSGPIAGVLLVVSALIGGRLPSNMLTTGLSSKRVLFTVACVLVAVAVVGWLTRARGVALQLPALVVTAAVVVMVLNRYETTFQAAFFFGTLFAGTALYRWTTGQLSTRAVVLLGVIVVMSVVIAQMHDWSPWLAGQPQVNYRFHQAEVLTYLSAYATFLLALTYRHLHFPRVLTYLGTISYSLYLVHAVVLFTLPAMPSAPWRALVLGTVVSIAASSATYYGIEKPFIALGRRVTGAMPTRHHGVRAADPVSAATVPV